MGVGGPALFREFFPAVGFINEVIYSNFFLSGRCFSQKGGEEVFL